MPAKYRMNKATPCAFTPQPNSRAGINAPISKAYTGSRAEQVISGAIKIVTKRSRGLAIVRVAMIPGIAQAKLESSGINERPDRPTVPITRSSSSAARGKYPVSSNSRIKKNNTMICGKNTRTPPTPATKPSTTKLRKIPSGNKPPSHSPTVVVAVSIKPIGHSDHEKTAWKITNSNKASVTEPNSGCNTQRSI